MNIKTINTVEHLIKIAEETDLSEISVSNAGANFHISRHRKATAIQKTRDGVCGKKDETAASSNVAIISPMVGFFLPNKEPLQVGDTVKEGDILGYIESLTIRNEVYSLVSGVIQAIHITANSPVQYGQIIFEIKTESI